MMLPPPLDGWTPEEAALQQLASLELYRKLPTDWERIVTVLKFELYWSNADIARATGRSDTTVRNCIKRIRVLVKQKNE